MFHPQDLDAMYERRDREAAEALKQRLSTSYGRFGWRIEKWKKETGSALPHHFWWFVHNCIAHPAIGVVPVRPTFAFHDYTSRKINREEISPSRDWWDR